MQKDELAEFLIDRIDGNCGYQVLQQRTLTFEQENE